MHGNKKVSVAICLMLNLRLTGLLVKTALVPGFKYLPDSRGMQITAYICMQLASKSSSLISCIIDTNSQSISLSFWLLKMCKIQRENIFKRPINVLFHVVHTKHTDDDHVRLGFKILCHFDFVTYYDETLITV